MAFSLTLEGMSSLDFIAPDEKVFDYWTDGINALLGKLISKDNANVDLDVLIFINLFNTLYILQISK